MRLFSGLIPRKTEEVTDFTCNINAMDGFENRLLTIKSTHKKEALHNKDSLF